MAASDFVDNVQRIFIAFYGRPADPAGLTFWTNQANEKGIAGVINAFATSDEAFSLYGNQATTLFVNRIYLQLFGRDADASGLKYWTDRIEGLSKTESRVTKAEAALFILNGAQDGDVRQGGTLDLTGVNKKVAIANQFTTAVNTASEIKAYNGDDAARLARDYISSINADTVLIEQNVNTVVAQLESQFSTTGVAKFSLTSAIDIFAGTRGADQYTADNRGAQVVSQLGDSVDGGALGDDSFLILGRVGTLPGTISGIETIILQETQGTNVQLNLTNLRDNGATASSLRNLILNDVRTDLTVFLPETSIINDVQVRDVVLQNAIPRNLVIDYNNPQQLTAQLTLQNLNLGRSQILLSGDYDTVSLISKGTSNTLVDGLNLLTTKPSIDRLVLSGPAAVDLGVLLGSSVATLDASQLGAGLTVDLNSNANVIGSAFADTITDSAGNDALQGNAGDDKFVITAGVDSIEGGAGLDSLVIKDDQRFFISDSSSLFDNIFSVEGLLTDVTVNDFMFLGSIASSKGISRIGLSDQNSAVTLNRSFVNEFDITTGDGLDTVSFDLLTSKGGKINTALKSTTPLFTAFEDIDSVQIMPGLENVIDTVLSLKDVGNGNAFKSGSSVDLAVSFQQQDSSSALVGPAFSTDDEGVAITIQNQGSKTFEVTDSSDTTTVLGEFSILILGTDLPDTIGSPASTVSTDQLLVGGSGADTIFGGLGQDFIYGGKGVDSLQGGGGIDVYSFTTGDSASVSITTSVGLPLGTADVITGNIQDFIQIRVAGITALTATTVLDGAAINQTTFATSGTDVIVYRQNGQYFLAYETSQGSAGTFGSTEIVKLVGVVDDNDQFTVSAEGMVSFTAVT